MKNGAGLSQSPVSNAYVLLTLTTLAWAGNTVAARLAIGEVSSMALVSLRWFISFALMSVFVRADVGGIWRQLRARPAYFGVMGFIGFTGFNALYYIAAHSTFAINLGIMQSATPLFVMVGAAIFHKSRISPGQVVGLVLGSLGVAAVVSGGSLTVLQSLSFNRGDLLVLLASALYAGYSLGLKHRPQDCSGITFFAAMALVAAVTSVPLLAWEAASGALQWPTLRGWQVIAFVAVFPSLLAQIWYIRGVSIIGAARAGFFFNAIPIFGAIMAVAILGEPFGWHHAAGLALVLGGIGIAERYKPG